MEKIIPLVKKHWRETTFALVGGGLGFGSSYLYPPWGSLIFVIVATYGVMTALYLINRKLIGSVTEMKCAFDAMSNLATAVNHSNGELHAEARYWRARALGLPTDPGYVPVEQRTTH